MESEKVKEIKKALECCSTEEQDNSCNECPYRLNYRCSWNLDSDALTLINELESENERLVESCKNCHYIKDLEIANGHSKELKDRIAELEKENARLANRITCQVILPDEKLKEIKKECIEKVELAKGELLKQFAERLKEKLEESNFINNGLWLVDTQVLIDETLKEFINVSLH
jgi:DNA-binding transcriptional MerR regulator